MSRIILRELSELVNNGVITEETAERIKHYYNNSSSSGNRLLIVFGILGALLTGLGFILIVAHNWDGLSKPVKLFFAFLPMLLGQVACGILLFKRMLNTVWKEAASVFLFLSIAVSISIVSQVYNIEGDLETFLLTWAVIGYPVIYVMRSSMTSLVFIAVITWYACGKSYFDYPTVIAWWYWFLLAAIIPYYRSLQYKTGNFFHFHSWFVAVSVTITLGMFGDEASKLIYIAYFSLFSAFVLIGQSKPFEQHKLPANAFLISGTMGTIVLLLTLSFKWFWKELHEIETGSLLNINSSELWVTALTTTVAMVLLVYNLKHKSIRDINEKAFTFLVVIVLYAVGTSFPLTAQLLTNLLILIFGIVTILEGTRQNNLGVLNYGLVVLTALIICRFFDTNLSFVVRGILFIAVGAAFFAANIYMVKKKNSRIL